MPAAYSPFLAASDPLAINSGDAQIKLICAPGNQRNALKKTSCALSELCDICNMLQARDMVYWAGVALSSACQTQCHAARREGPRVAGPV